MLLHYRNTSSKTEKPLSHGCGFSYRQHCVASRLPLLWLSWCRGLSGCSWCLGCEELGGHFINVVKPAHEVWMVAQGLGKAVHWPVSGVALPLASSFVHALRHVRANVHLDKRILDELWIFGVGQCQAVGRILGAALPKAR